MMRSRSSLSYRIRVFSSTPCGVAGGGEGVKTVVTFDCHRFQRMEGFRRIPYQTNNLLDPRITMEGNEGGSTPGNRG